MSGDGSLHVCMLGREDDGECDMKATAQNGILRQLGIGVTANVSHPWLPKESS